MPALQLTPSLTQPSSTNFTVSTYRRAADIPLTVLQSFCNSPQRSNIIHAHVEQSIRLSELEEHDELWIVAWEFARDEEPSQKVLFVLSCTSGPLGTYPIFIFTPVPSFTEDFLYPRLRALVHELQQNVPPERVFSVFSIDMVTDVFATLWASETGIQLDLSPCYYHATLMYCNNTTIEERCLPPPTHMTIDIRLADEADLSRVAPLCHGFAAGSEPFVLSCEQATQEARLLIHKGQVWVHEMQTSGEETDIVSIVAATRVTDSVAAITKVYTKPEWRGHKCAERLVRHVTQHLLASKDVILLYVAHTNPAAATVYKHVGFRAYCAGLDGAADSWKELGFDRSKVQIGHW